MAFLRSLTYLIKVNITERRFRGCLSVSVAAKIPNEEVKSGKAEVAELNAILITLHSFTKDDLRSTANPGVIWKTEGHQRIMGNRWDGTAIDSLAALWSRTTSGIRDTGFSWALCITSIDRWISYSKLSYQEHQIIDIHLHQSPKITEEAPQYCSVGALLRELRRNFQRLECCIWCWPYISHRSTSEAVVSWE